MGNVDQSLRELEQARRPVKPEIPLGTFPTRAEQPPQAGLILQRTPSDCNICTIAMATGLSYEEVEAAAIEAKEYNPTKGGMLSSQETFKRLGYINEYSNAELTSRSNVIFMHCPYGTDNTFFARMFRGREAIFSVPSRNKVGGYHSIYYNGYEIFDPSNRHVYTNLSEVATSGVTCFTHLPHKASDSLVSNALSGVVSELVVS